MIEKERLDFIKANLRHRKDLDYYSSCFIYCFPFGFFIIGLSILYNVIKFGNNDLLLGGLIFLIISIPLFFFTNRRLSDILKFESENIENNKFDFNDLYDEIQTKFRLRSIMKDDNKKIIKAYTKWSAFSWGEEITIILDNNRILLNSRPTGIYQLVTICKDRQNIQRIRAMIITLKN
jgi:hypothetical protein